MKFLEKLSLTIFSTIILILSLILCLILFGWLEATNIHYFINYIASIPTATNITLVTLVIFMLLAIKCIFFPSYSKDKELKTEGILLQNESGKLLISIETIENLVKGVVAGFPNAKSVNCKVKLDKTVNNVIIDMNLVVTSETIIKELSANLQNKVKNSIENMTGIKVEEVNVHIQGVNIEAIKSEEKIAKEEE